VFQLIKFSALLFYFLFFSIYLNSETNSVDSEMNLQTVKKITPQQAHDLIEKLKYDPDFVILDLRTPEEYKKEHIKNAKNLNYYSKTFKNELNKLEKDKTYVIHCRSGGRSGKTAPIMKELGFNEVYDMGGITQWKEQGFETVK